MRRGTLGCAACALASPSTSASSSPPRSSGTLVAAALGATNLGTALTFGQIAFAVALVWVLLKR